MDDEEFNLDGGDDDAVVSAPEPPQPAASAVSEEQTTSEGVEEPKPVLISAVEPSVKPNPTPIPLKAPEPVQPSGIVTNDPGSISKPSVDIDPADKLKLRAARFGIDQSSVSEDQKKAQRAARFGIVSTGESSTASKAPAAGGKAVNPEEQAKILKRAERFGAISKVALNVEADKLKKEEEEKKALRAQRFKMNVSVAELEEEQEK